MEELSLNVLDIAQNSVRAERTFIEIEIVAYGNENKMLSITIKDNGKGMDKQKLENVTNPFFTSRTTRKVGLGVPFFKQARIAAGGSFNIESTPGKGTVVTATFDTSNIDCAPLGDMADTVGILISMNPDIDFVYSVKSEDRIFALNTLDIKKIMDGVPLSEPRVAEWIKDYIRENENEVFKRRY
jgi:anti-sigma regulatory factor (Ser/Thr protein kinase)